MKSIKIENYQLRELINQELYINKYDMSLKYSYELDIYWKEFFFDILQLLNTKRDFFLHADEKESLFDYFKKDYYNIIRKYKLNIDKDDYVEITDYISYDEWEKNPKNGIGYFTDGIYLIQK